MHNLCSPRNKTTQEDFTIFFTISAIPMHLVPRLFPKDPADAAVNEYELESVGLFVGKVISQEVLNG